MTKRERKSQPPTVTLERHIVALIDAHDRRYSELAIASKEALQIKEAEQEKALTLARDIQVYKDERANDLRSQIERERGEYATKDDLDALADKLVAMMQPLATYVAGQQGRAGGWNSAAGYIIAAITVVIAYVTRK